jgi:hypothetical protein
MPAVPMSKPWGVGILEYWNDGFVGIGSFTNMTYLANKNQDKFRV